MSYQFLLSFLLCLTLRDCIFSFSWVWFFLLHQVKVLFVRNLATTVTEEILEKSFSEFGKLERVKKLKDYAFVHFEDRGAAVKVG